MNSIVKKLTEPKTGKHLGDLVGWSLQGNKDQALVADMAFKHGLTEDLGLPHLAPSSGYRRAVLNATKGRSADVKKHTIVKIEETDQKIVHSIVRKDIVHGGSSTLTDKDAVFSNETKVCFDKASAISGTKSVESLLSCDDPYHPIYKRIRDEYETLCVMYTANDIRIAFQRAFETWGAIRLIGRGGLWWVPAPFEHKVRDWANFIQDLNYQSVVIPCFDTEETINSLRAQSKQNLENQLAEMIEEMESFGNRDNVRKSTLEKRVAQFDALRNKVELHAMVLGNKQTELLEKLNQAQKDLVASMVEPTVEPVSNGKSVSNGKADRDLFGNGEDNA